jgi:hypothetical protein
MNEWYSTCGVETTSVLEEFTLLRILTDLRPSSISFMIFLALEIPKPQMDAAWRLENPSLFTS